MASPSAPKSAIHHTFEPSPSSSPTKEPAYEPLFPAETKAKAKAKPPAPPLVKWEDLSNEERFIALFIKEGGTIERANMFPKVVKMWDRIER